MQEIDLGTLPALSPEVEGLAQLEPATVIIFDEKVNWGGLPFTIAVDSQRLTDFMRNSGMNDDAISEYKMHLYWSRSRMTGGAHSPMDKEIRINVNRFRDNKKESQLTKLHTSAEELTEVTSILNGVLHHEVGHVVEPEEIRRHSVRQRVIMLLGSLSLPEAGILLKDMSISRPSFDETLFVTYSTLCLLLMTTIYNSTAAPNEIFASRFEYRLKKENQWADIIKLLPKDEVQTTG